MPNLEDILDPKTALDIEMVLMAKEFKLNDTSPTNNNQTSSSNPRNMQIAQPGMNMSQDRHMLMVDDNVGNQFIQNVSQSATNKIKQNVVQNQGIQNVRHQIRLSVVPSIENQYGNGNVVAARAEGNGNGINGADEEVEEVNANCTLDGNLQQASTSGTQIDKAPIYDSYGSTEVVQICLWCVDSGCSQHMTGNLKILIISSESFWELSALEMIILL
ncbi:hypothetical protein Tco_1113526 [Tanacetum coccineum]|uniref:Uncharacterized protein n=1 Tax=Tanacetum coccineum TaxID=301880 RepID=A0ABQ5ISE9_9ASTR